MKKAFAFTAVFLMMLSPAFSREKHFPPLKQVVSMADVDTQMIQEMILGLHSDLAIQCEAGAELPLRSLHHFGLFTVKHNPNLSMEVEKTCYLRCVKRKVYVSEDLITWEKPKDFFSGKPEAKLKVDDAGLLVETTLVPFEEDFFQDWE